MPDEKFTSLYFHNGGAEKLAIEISFLSKVSLTNFLSRTRWRHFQIPRTAPSWNSAPPGGQNLEIQKIGLNTYLKL